MSSPLQRLSITNFLSCLREHLPKAHESVDILIVSKSSGYTRKIVGYTYFHGRHHAQVQKENGIISVWRAEHTTSDAGIKKVLGVYCDKLRHRITIQIT